MATGSRDGKIRIYCLDTLKYILTIDTRTNHALAVSWSPAGRRLAVICTNNDLHVYNALSGNLKFYIKIMGDTVVKSYILGISMSPDAMSIASGRRIIASKFKIPTLGVFLTHSRVTAIQSLHRATQMTLTN